MKSRCSHNLKSDQQGSSKRICVLIMRITSKTIDQRFWKGTTTQRSKAGLFLHYYILVIRKFTDFMSLFRHSVWFSISVKQFSSAELRIADKNRRRVEPSSSVLLQTLGKLRSLQGTALLVVVKICLLRSFWIFTLNSRCWLIVINGVKCYENRGGNVY